MALYCPVDFEVIFEVRMGISVNLVQSCRTDWAVFTIQFIRFVAAGSCDFARHEKLDDMKCTSFFMVLYSRPSLDKYYQWLHPRP